MEDEWKAEDIGTGSKVCFLFILGATAVLYLYVGCSRDWVVIAGLAVDGVGAFLLAAPDLGVFHSLTYSGNLRNATNELSREKGRYISRNEPWYDVFVDEMEEILGTTDIPEEAYFEVKRVLNSNLLFYYSGPQKSGTPINLHNVIGPLRAKIDEEEKLVRRFGAYLFVAGIILQIFGILIEHVVFPGIFC